jgi:hypothetical protein
MRVTNDTKGRVLAERAEVADTFIGRLRGLIGRKALEAGEALIIEPCNSIHTIGMRFPIDVLFLDAEDRVVGIRTAVRPGRATRIFWRARRAVELPVPSIERSGTDLGDRIRIE